MQLARHHARAVPHARPQPGRHQHHGEREGRERERDADGGGRLGIKEHGAIAAHAGHRLRDQRAVARSLDVLPRQLHLLQLVVALWQQRELRRVQQVGVAHRGAAPVQAEAVEGVILAHSADAVAVVVAEHVFALLVVDGLLIRPRLRREAPALDHRDADGQHQQQDEGDEQQQRARAAQEAQAAAQGVARRRLRRRRRRRWRRRHRRHRRRRHSRLVVRRGVGGGRRRRRHGRGRVGIGVAGGGRHHEPRVGRLARRRSASGRQCCTRCAFLRGAHLRSTRQAAAGRGDSPPL